MRCVLMLACALTLAVAAAPAQRLPAGAPRSRADWIALRDAKFAIPAGLRAIDLLRDMNPLLASPDPVLRDAVAYEGAARWIFTDGALSSAEQRELLALWVGNLVDGLGEPAGDAAYRRSFSALNLSLLAARDNAAPFLTQVEFDRFFEDVLDYFARERDTRGYDDRTGWIHAAAHTGDVLKFLARNPKLTRGQQARLLSAIDTKCASFGEVFRWAEDERLAQVVAALARRPDLDRTAFDAWLASIGPRRSALWSKSPAIESSRFPEVQNLKLVLRAAYVSLSLDRDPAPGRAAADAVLATLKALR